LFCAYLLVVTGLAGCSGAPPVAIEEGAKRTTPVKTVAVVQQNVQRTTTQPATVHSFYRAEVRAKASGYVKEVKADLGDFVEDGAVLAVIDVPEMTQQRRIIEARITRYESVVERANAGVELANANVRAAEAMLAQSKSQMSQVDASVAAMEAEFTRVQDLVERRSLEARMLDEVRKKRDSERANKEAMASAIQSAEAEVAVAQAKTASAQAEVKTAEAETVIARLQLEEIDVLIAYATLKAPFAGVVTRRTVDPGDLVREGSEVGNGEPLFVISQLEKVRVQIPVPEVDAALVRQGDAVSLSFPAFPAEQPIKATVTRLAGDLDPSTRTMLVEADADNPDRKLIPGMFGQATISLSNTTVANMLPARAIRFRESGEAYVYIVESDQTVTVTPITTGIDNGRAIEVTSGVEPGQQVIDAHLKRFTSGQKVVLLGE